MRHVIPIAALALLTAGAAADPPDGPVPGLLLPIPLAAGGDTVTRPGDLFPFVADVDGDGKPDLLLGTGEKGRMLLARNTGRAGELAFGPTLWFDELNPGVTIPAG